MGLRVNLVNVTPNEIVYLITNEVGGESGGALGTAITITAADAVSLNSRDLVVDCVNSTFGRATCSRFRQACRAGLDGLGSVAAEAWTQAQARDLFSGNGATQAGGPLMPRLEIDLQPATGVAGGPVAEADINVDGGLPIINITTAAVAGTCIMRIRLRSTPGVR